MDKLLEELECPVCTDYFTLPIRQCSTGHSICSKCMNRLDKCPLCQSIFTDCRNITLEGLALKMKYPCYNKDSGCMEVFAYGEREKHELRCNFKGFRTYCAMKGCDFIGDTNLLKSHWLSKKTSSKIYQTVATGSTKLKNDSFYVNLTEGFGELFWFKCKTFNNNIYFAMQFIGKNEEAKQYYFEIEISKSDFKRKKIILSDYCKSLELTDKELFMDGTCTSLNFGNLSQFLSNDNINYTMKLLKDKSSSNVKNNSRSKSRDKLVKDFVKLSLPPQSSSTKSTANHGSKPKTSRKNVHKPKTSN